MSLEQNPVETVRRGAVVWLTGLSGSGKSTLATALCARLRERGHPVVVVDGDNLRAGLSRDLGFGDGDRRENVRRAGEVGRLVSDAGVVAIVALISPFREDRALARSRMGGGLFVEVYVNAPLEVCERRDPKGLYRRARSGALPEFTGISSPYEAPLEPEVELRTDQWDVTECVRRICERLDGHWRIHG